MSAHPRPHLWKLMTRSQALAVSVLPFYRCVEQSSQRPACCPPPPCDVVKPPLRKLCRPFFLSSPLLVFGYCSGFFCQSAVIVVFVLLVFQVGKMFTQMSRGFDRLLCRLGEESLEHMARVAERRLRDGLRQNMYRGWQCCDVLVHSLHNFHVFGGFAGL
jgi:hypothetical protein